MKKFVIITYEYKEDPYIRKTNDGFTMLFDTKKEAQEIIDENGWDEDSSIIELFLQK